MTAPPRWLQRWRKEQGLPARPREPVSEGPKPPPRPRNLPKFKPTKCPQCYPSGYCACGRGYR